MDSIWNATLTNSSNSTYTCALMDVEHATALKRLEIKWKAGGSFVAIVEPTPEGVYIKEIAMQGERLGFDKQNGMLLPVDIKEGDTWQVSTRKERPLVRIAFKMGLTAVKSETNTLAISVDIEVNVRALFKKIHETVQAVVSMKPHENFKFVSVELPNADTYVNRT